MEKCKLDVKTNMIMKVMMIIIMCNNYNSPFILTKKVLFHNMYKFKYYLV